MFARVFDTVAPLHRRQDDARDPVSAAARRHQGAGQAVRRRDGGSLRPSGATRCILLVLIKPWGLNLSWPQISYASLVVMARVDRRWRSGRSAATWWPSGAASSTRTCSRRICATPSPTCSRSRRSSRSSAIPTPRHVLHAIDLLEGFDKRHLISPLLLHHESPDGPRAGAAHARSGASRRAGAVVGGHRADAEGRASRGAGGGRARAGRHARRTGRRA